MSSIRKAYRTILQDFFPEKMTLSLGEDELTFTKRLWSIPNEAGEMEEKGLRYGDNPDQPAALYQWTGGEIKLNDLTLRAGRPLISGLSEKHFIQFGKHPGKTNLTDVNSGVSILINLPDMPAAVILKHNNPCGVAVAETIHEAYDRAYFSDRIAAMGGCIVVNRTLDAATARAVASSYSEVVVAPAYEPESIEILKGMKNLRVI
ncbi:IMP cyclohydrolase, partial [Myxococcota bacterium]|nr:IMP cyclohydrolase [Myxococcota bacterium]